MLQSGDIRGKMSAHFLDIPIGAVEIKLQYHFVRLKPRKAIAQSFFPGRIVGERRFHFYRRERGVAVAANKFMDGLAVANLCNRLIGLDQPWRDFSHVGIDAANSLQTFPDGNKRVALDLYTA